MLLEELKEVRIRLDRLFDYIPTESVKDYKNADEIESDYLAIRPSVRRRLDRLSKEMDEGHGRKFKNAKEFSKYLGNL